MKVIYAALGCIAVAGCATTAGYEKMLKTWVGAPEERLIGRWGPPDSVYNSGDAKYLTYVRASQGYVPGTAPSYRSTIVGNTVYTQQYGGTPGYAYTNFCKTTFGVRGGTIFNWRWEGNACRMREE